MIRTDARSVSGITAIIKTRLEDLPPMVVIGEVLNLKPANASGHLYFSLGDEHAKISVTFFSFRQKAQRDLPQFKNGDKIYVTGPISVYAPTGSYQINATRVELADGRGELLQRFEAYKQTLCKEGLWRCNTFVSQQLPAGQATRPARALPLLPRRIGIVTAATGAAIHDILSILSRRFPNLHILVAPTRVQGAGAAEEIAAAIQRLNSHFGPSSSEPLDAIIVGRGGGSYEDLWCFNEPAVAQAVIASELPIISAVGHEPDIAIIDFLADVRAATPSAAAELLCGKHDDLLLQNQQQGTRLLNALRSTFKNARNEVRAYAQSPFLVDPLRLLESHAQRTDALSLRLNAVLERKLALLQQTISRSDLALAHLQGAFLPKAQLKLQSLTAKLEFSLQSAQKAAAAKVELLESKLTAYNPYAVLARGYSLTTDAEGNVITAAQQVPPDATLHVQLAEGALTVRNLGVAPNT